MTNIVISLTGPTCSGKNYLLQKLMDKGYTPIVSTTTRPKREGEVEGIDYYFIEKDEFSDSFIYNLNNEYIELVSIGGYEYGTKVSEFKNKVENSDMPCVVILDPHGAEEYFNYERKCRTSVNFYKEKLKSNNVSVGDNIKPGQPDFHLLTVYVETPELARISRLIDRTTNELKTKEHSEVVASLVYRCKNIFQKETDWKSKMNWNIEVPGDDVWWAIETIEYYVKSLQKRIEKLK